MTPSLVSYQLISFEIANIFLEILGCHAKNLKETLKHT
jgi:hypothetical protein